MAGAEGRVLASTSKAKGAPSTPSSSHIAIGAGTLGQIGWSALKKRHSRPMSWPVAT